ncbi:MULTISPECIES: hypothetical protein [unclassified Endozoicomonas]|nr:MULTISPECIES: hypothetical protein [unclassified Endozoicomonas]
MSNEIPTRVHVVSWFFMIIGSLSVLSGAGNLMVRESGDLAISIIWPVLMQIFIALMLIVGGYGLLKGSELMRKLLVRLSFLILILMAIFYVDKSFDFSFVYSLAIGYLFYLVPLIFVIRALQSDITKGYTNRNITRR